MRHPCHHALATPDKVTHVMARSGETVSYRQLEDRSNQGAQLLRSLGAFARCAADCAHRGGVRRKKLASGADLFEHRQQVRAKRLRVFAHREMPDARHHDVLRAADAPRNIGRLRGRRRVIVFA